MIVVIGIEWLKNKRESELFKEWIKRSKKCVLVNMYYIDLAGSAGRHWGSTFMTSKISYKLWHSPIQAFRSF